MNQLEKINIARNALAEAKEIHEVKQILDQAEAVKYFTQQQNYSIEIQNHANVFCIEAQIRLGEMLKEMPKNEGGTPEKKQYKNSTGTKTEPVEKQPATYAELNINKKDASRWQGMAENKKEITEKIEELEAQGKPIKESTIINQVRKEKHHEEVKRGNKTLPSNKYRIFLADPPWDYGNSGLPSYGHAETHYPSLPIEELCNLKIKDLSEDNAVLFLWVTSPLLEDCFKVINAWGFKYKSSFVWDKIKHNFGYYNSVRHELLLICTKGSCLPDTKELYDSVLSIERSKIHSQKPEEFRKLIETLYVHGNKIELFAREKIAGWDSWGNQ